MSKIHSKIPGDHNVGPSLVLLQNKWGANVYMRWALSSRSALLSTESVKNGDDGGITWYAGMWILLRQKLAASYCNSVRILSAVSPLYVSSLQDPWRLQNADPTFALLQNDWGGDVYEMSTRPKVSVAEYRVIS